MSFTQWLSKVLGRRSQVSRASRRGKSRQPSRLRNVPRLELLEDRLAPATLTFDFATIGGAGQAATLKLDSSSGTPTLEVLSGGSVVASQSLSGTSNVAITGEGNDSLTLDFTNPFAEPIQFNYNVAGNTLDIIGSAGPAMYTPTAGVAGAGQVQVGSSGSSTILFSGLSSLAVSNLASFTFTTPAGDNNVTIASPSSLVNSISGTSAGTAFVPVTFSNVTSVTINTAVNDTASSVDTLTIESSGLVAGGLENFMLTTGSGNNMLLDYAGSYSLPVSGGTFAFNGGSGTNTLVGPSPSINPNLALTNVGQSIPVPVMVLPGFLGSFATPAATTAWFSSIGLPPSELELDPIENTYADLVQTLENVGYVNGQTLFQTPWDWRLPVAPQDGTIDGMLSNLTVAELTGGVYHYAVDYLGTALVTAVQGWASDFDGRSLPAVNVVTHSTGGNIARAYIQSPAYGQALPSGLTLPKINDFVMMAGANQGSLDAFNALNNNYSGIPLLKVLSLLVGAGYDAVLAGGTITSPNGNINLASITVNGQPSIQEFLSLGCASLYDLLPTFPYLSTGSGPLTIGFPGMENNLTLDMNDGLGLSNPPAGSDPNSFLDSPTNSLLGTLLNEYSTSVSMPYLEVQQPAGTGSVVPLGSIFAETPTTTWYQPVIGIDNGDDTLTDTSTIGQFLGSPLLGTKVILDQIQPSTPGGLVAHEDIPSNSTALANMLSEFGQNDSPTVIAQAPPNLDQGAILQRVLSVLPSASFSWHGLTFEASHLQVQYDILTNVFTFTGPSSLTIPGIGAITIALGANSTGGLVVTGDNFTSLDATISGDLTIDGLTLHSDGLELTYVASTGDFEIQGAADVSLGGPTVNVTLGDNEISGLVVQNGMLANLHMVVAQLQHRLVVSKASQTINFTAPTSPITFAPNETVTLSASASSGDQVAFSIDPSSTGTGSISDSTLTVTGAGIFVIDANQTGDNNYNAATQVQQTLMVTKADQTITFSPLAAVTYGDPDFPIRVTASSGLPVSFTARGNAIVQQVAGVWYVHILAAGNATITAHQAGNVSYDAAPHVAQGFTIALGLSSLSDWTVNRPYTPVTASGGTRPYKFALTSGALPKGLKLNANGTFSGSPTATGTYTFTLKATQGTSLSGTRSYAVNIHAAPTIGNLTVTQWTKGKSCFTGTMTIANGTPLYAIVGRPAGVPPGLTAVLSANTVRFTGTPSAAGTFHGSITIRDLAGAQVTQTFTIKINAAPTFTPAKLGLNQPGKFYSQTITTTGGTGKRTVSYTLSGPLPTGLTIGPPSPATGDIIISGKTSATTSVTLTMTVTDSIGAQTTITYQLAPGR